MSLMNIDDFGPFVDGLDHPEGVAWGPDGFVYAGGEAGQIYRITLDGSQITQVGSTGGFILGVALDADRNVYACDLGLHKLMKITPNGEVSVYSDGSPERKMVTPNYPVFDHAGHLFVSDSGTWKGNNGCIFRIEPGGRTRVVSTALTNFPNGMALSPDGNMLYVVLSLVPGVARAAILPDGSLGEPEIVVELPKNIPDGIAFDEQGNLYIACYTPDVIHRLTPDGELSVVAEDWQSVIFSSPTNITFAGADRRTLVVASLARWHLTKGTMPIAGQPIPYPKLS